MVLSTNQSMSGRMDGKRIFETLFRGMDFGMMPEDAPPAADCEASLEILDDVTTPFRAKEIQEKISLGCQGAVALPSNSSAGKSRLHVEANDLFREDRFSEAVSKYREVIREVPDDYRLYTNIALCQLKLQNYKDAIVYSGVVARFLDKKWLKAQVALVSAQCRLGYVQLALSYAEAVGKRYSGGDADKIEEHIESSRKSVSKSMLRVADVSDFNAAVDLMFDRSLSDEELLFLFYHCLCHFETGSYSPSVERAADVIDKVVSVNQIVRRSTFDMAAFSLEQQHVLLCYVTFVAEYLKLSAAFAEGVIKRESFTSFIVKMAKYFSTQRGMSATKRASPFGKFIFDSYIKILVGLASQTNILSKFLLKTDPFNAFEWHASMAVSSFCILPFEAIRNDDVDFVFDCVPYLLNQFLHEESFIEQFTGERADQKKKVFENAFAILAAVSIFEFRTMDDPQSFVSVWSTLVKDDRAAAFCVERPGVWTYLIGRLARFSDSDSENEPNSQDILMNLGVLSNLLEYFIYKNPDGRELGNWNADNNANAIAKSVAELAACQGRFRQLEEEADLVIANTFRLTAYFASRSPAFFQALAKVDFLISNMISSILFGLHAKPTHLQPALYCLAIFTDLRNNTLFRNRLMLNNKFADLVHRVVSLVGSGDKQVMTNAILILKHLFETNDRCKNAAYQSLAVSERQTLVRQLVTYIRANHSDAPSSGFYSRSLAISAGLLLSVLLKLDQNPSQHDSALQTGSGAEPLDVVLARVLKDIREMPAT